MIPFRRHHHTAQIDVPPPPLEPVEQRIVGEMAKTYRDTRISLRDSRFWALLVVIVAIGFGFGVFLAHDESSFKDSINRSLDRDHQNCLQLNATIGKINGYFAKQIKVILERPDLTPKQKALATKNYRDFFIPLQNCKR